MRVSAVCFLILGLASAISADDGSWRGIPQRVRPASADTVSRSVRRARDSFFDRFYVNGMDRGATFEEIPANNSATVVLGRFADYVTLRSASGKSVYTEIRLNVAQILRDPSGSARAGKDVTVTIDGGSLRLPSGKILRMYPEQETGLQPGHRFLAFLWYARDGDYFICEKTWDLTTGVAVPTYPLDVEKARNGTSRFAGMPEDQFVAAVREILLTR